MTRANTAEAGDDGRIAEVLALRVNYVLHKTSINVATSVTQFVSRGTLSSKT
jgi:hypothetical protein